MSFDFKNFLEIKENKNKNIQKLPTRNIRKIEHTLLIDSRNRNRNTYINPSQFVVKIDSGSGDNPTIYHKYKNISQIFLTNVVLPKRIVSYPYLVLDIPELQSVNIGGTNQLLQNGFAVLIPEHHQNDGDFVNCTIQYMDYHKHNYYPPLASLPQTLTITLYEPNGTMANLGTDNSLPSPVKDTVQCFFIFKVICLEESFDNVNSYLVN